MDEFLEGSDKGAILVSLNSNFLNDKISNLVLKTFAELPQYNFIFKIASNDILISSTENIYVDKFTLQNDILAHPKVVAFLSNSDRLSTQAACHYGVPIIGKIVQINK